MYKRQETADEVIVKASYALGHFLSDGIVKCLELVRLARAGVALLTAGCGSESRLWIRTAEDLVSRQKPDGGWSDPEETGWALALVRQVHGEAAMACWAALRWLANARNPGGGWGRHARDRARIPVTALISTLIPDAFIEKDLVWLVEEWRKDFSGSVRLSYKAGFFLLAMSNRPMDELITQTTAHLAEDQNDDGGFGPWKDHPIGSDPWSTGVVLWGLSKWIDHVDEEVIRRAQTWLERTQLPSGYWPYHYLDDGTSMALIGAVSALKALAGKKQ